MPREAGAFLRCHEKTAIRYAREGIVPAIRLGGKLWRVRQSDIPERAGPGSTTSSRGALRESQPRPRILSGRRLPPGNYVRAEPCRQ
jgi:hypothetical protein